MLYVSERQGSRELYDAEVGRRGRVGDAAQVPGGADAHSISISRDGSSLVYSKYTHTRNVWSTRIGPTSSASLAQAQPLTDGRQIVEAMGVSSAGDSIKCSAN